MNPPSFLFRNRTLLHIVPWAALLALFAPAAYPGDLDVILERERQYLLEAPRKSDDAQCRRWVETLDAKGKWPDVGYTLNKATRAYPYDHLERIRELAIAWQTPGNPLFQDAATKKAALRAVDGWLDLGFKSGHWWHDQIGQPRWMRDLLVLLPDMGKSRREGCLDLLKNYRVTNTGANLVWSADLALHHGALTGDENMVAEMSARIADEIKIGAYEGIQKDYSFHQHGARLQQFGYGGAFLADTARLSWLLSGSPWAFPPEKTDILADYILEGSQWMMRSGVTVPGTMDRSASRPDSLKVDISRNARFLAEANPKFRKELEAVAAQAPLTGFRTFPKSDFTAYHRPDFAFFVKTISDRTLTVEKINKENLLGDLMNCGDAYLIADGNEYHNMQPVWDWKLLPGVTAAPSAGKVFRRRFVGGLGNGASGFAVMDARFGGFGDKENSLSCKKMWAAHGDTVVCLIAGLSATAGAGPVRTAMDQSRLRGPVTVGSADGTRRKVPPGTESLEKAAWIHHGTFAYFPLEPAGVSLTTGPVSGSWRRINEEKTSPADPMPVEDAVFLPVLEHGNAPSSARAAYVLAFAPTPGDAEKLAGEKSWKILRNDPSCQAVSFPDGTVMAAFYRPGSLPGMKEVSADQPGLVLLDSSGKIHREIPGGK